MVLKIKKRLALSFVTIVALSVSVLANSAEYTANTVVENENFIGTSAKTSSPRNNLMKLLGKFSAFSASFRQEIQDEDGNVLQLSSGEITVRKPNLVNWHTQLPDENLIVSDGDTLWLYDPFIEQVTAFSLDTSIVNTPILLLSSDDKLLWQQYIIEQKSDSEFIIISKDENAQVKRLKIVFSKDNTEITQFVIFDASGQHSNISLANFKLTPQLNEQTFKFTVPEGVFIDDQR